MTTLDLHKGDRVHVDLNGYQWFEATVVYADGVIVRVTDAADLVHNGWYPRSAVRLAQTSQR